MIKLYGCFETMASRISGAVKSPCIKEKFSPSNSPLSNSRERGERSAETRTAPGAFLVSVDLSPLSREFDRGLFNGENFSFIQGDFTAPDIREAIVSKQPYNLIISDAAPATTGSRVVDTSRSLALAEAAAFYAETALAAGGSLVIKVFQGGDTSELLKRLGGLFKTAKSYKPQACRSDSFETYYLGFEKK